MNLTVQNNFIFYFLMQIIVYIVCSLLCINLFIKFYTLNIVLLDLIVTYHVLLDTYTLYQLNNIQMKSFMHFV